MTNDKPMPEALSKRIEEMVETEALEKYPKIMLPSGGGGLKYDPNYPQRCAYKDRFKAGCKWMYQEIQAMLSERDEDLNHTVTAYDKLQEENTRLKSQLKAAEEENEQLMNVEYWPDRYKIEAKKVEELRAFIEEWLAFEESCIKKDGPYVSDRIPKLMKKARETLTKLRGK